MESAAAVVMVVHMRWRHEIAIDPPFSVRREDAGDVAVLVVDGEVDMVTAPAIQQEFESIAPGTRVVIDLCAAPFMDSTGLRVLLDRRAHVACVPGGPVARLFEIAHVHELLPVFATRGEALAALRDPAAGGARTP